MTAVERRQTGQTDRQTDGRMSFCNRSHAMLDTGQILNIESGPYMQAIVKKWRPFIGHYKLRIHQQTDRFQECCQRLFHVRQQPSKALYSWSCQPANNNRLSQMCTQTSPWLQRHIRINNLQAILIMVQTKKTFFQNSNLHFTLRN